MDNSLKEHILEAIDLVALISERVSLVRKGKDYVGLCPFHDDHKPSMSVSPTKRIFKCWSCGAGGDAIKYVMLRERLTFPEALARLAARAGIELRRERGGGTSTNDAAREELRRVMSWARTHFHRVLNETPGGRAAREYAHSRGITDETIAALKIGFANDSWDELVSQAARVGLQPDVLLQAGLAASNDKGRVYDRFRNRLIFPICDAVGRPVAFGGRALGDDPAKYLNSPESALFSKSRILFNLDLARSQIEKTREVIVVEGYVDAVLVYQAGVFNVVATLGTAMTDAHVKLIRPLADRVYMCFDADEAGDKAADRALETALRHQLDVRVVRMNENEDPADCVQQKGVEGFRSFLLSSISALEFKWLATKRAFADNARGGRRAALDAYLNFIARTSVAGGLNALDEGLLISQMADLVNLPARAVYDQLAGMKAGLKRPGPVSTGPASGDISEQAAYDAAIRAIPAGLVVAAEELLGIVLAEPSQFHALDAHLARVAENCEFWQRLYRLFVRLEGELGNFRRADVIGHCDDADVCDLIERALRKTRGQALTPEWIEAVCRRFDSELERTHLVAQQNAARGADNEAQREEAFQALLDARRRQTRTAC